MTNQDYQRMVEEKYGKKLKDIMYGMCVINDVVASEGANILDVPKNTFISWRNKFSYGRMQRLCDFAEQSNKEKLEKYIDQLKTTNLTRQFNHVDNQSLQGLKEILERYLELEKAKKVIHDPEGLSNISLELNISFLEQALNYLDLYCSGNLHKKFEFEAQEVKNTLKEKGISD